MKRSALAACHIDTLKTHFGLLVHATHPGIVKKRAIGIGTRIAMVLADDAAPGSSSAREW